MTAKSTKTLSRAFILTGAVVAVAASAFAGVAVAQGRMQSGPNGPAGGPGGPGAPGGPRAGMFQMMDADKDGKVTKDEFLGQAGPLFVRFDVNKDGTVTREEITQVISKRIEARVARMSAPFDANGDGNVTKEEFDTFRTKRFALMDRNNDGVVDTEEVRVMMPMMGQGRGGWRGHHRGWGRGGPCQAGMRGAMMPGGMGPGGMPGGMMPGGWVQDNDGSAPAAADLDDGRGDQDDAQ